MPGELGNCIAGRVANLFNLHGPNFTTDAACASALAAMDATVEGLLAHEFDVAITGGVDRNMGAHAFVKFCAIGALSPDRDASVLRRRRRVRDGRGRGAVRGQAARATPSRDGDRIYAVVRGVGSASDGKGKGITAPNPVGQRARGRARLASGRSVARRVLADRGPRHLDARRGRGRAEQPDARPSRRRTWRPDRSRWARSSRTSATSRRRQARPACSRPTLALHDKVLPPSINFERPNPNLDWTVVPVRRQHRAARLGRRDRPHARRGRERVRLRRHQLPHRHGGVRARPSDHQRPSLGDGVQDAARRPSRRRSVKAATSRRRRPASRRCVGHWCSGRAPEEALANELRTALAEARQGRHLDPTPPSAEALRAPERIAIDYADGADLVAKAEMALQHDAVGQRGRVAGAARARDLPRQRRPREGRVPLHRPGLPVREHARRSCAGASRSSADLFDEADEIMAPLLEGRRLSEIMFADPDDPAAMARAEDELRRTEITAAGRDHGRHRAHPPAGRVRGRARTWSWATRSASTGRWSPPARCRLRTRSRRSARAGARWPASRSRTPGAMAAVLAPLAEVEEIVEAIDGYVVLANVNSTHQVVIGGATEAVEPRGRGAAGSEGTPRSRCRSATPSTPRSSRRRASRCARCSSASACARPQLPIVANVTGELYPTGDGVGRADASRCSRARSPRPCSSSRGCGRCTTRAPGCSSRSGPSTPCRASPPTCSATTRS